ncbi:MAG: anti-sigma factor [Acidobacteria bacterium]|nr:anti-sigma factor [Acidobacteriota bacterium]
MTPSHDDLKAYAGAYVLGSLDPDERAEFESHLAGCEDCAAEVRALGRVTEALARGVAQRTPPPELRDRVLATFGAPPQARPAARVRAGARSWLPLAALVVLTVGIGVYAAWLQVRVTVLEDRLEQALLQASAAEAAVAEARRVNTELQTTMGVLAAPDLVRIDLAGQAPAPQATARALWSRARGMVFTATNLPPLPAGQVYQVWVVTAAQPPISAGLLMPDAGGGGQTYFNTPPDIPPPAAVAVSIEPAGGVPAPTGAIYLVGKPGATS